MTLYLAVLVGILIYALLQLNEVLNKADFSWKGWFKIMTIPFVLSLIMGWSLVWLKDDLSNLLPITPLSSLFIGVSGQAIFKKIGAIFDKKISTFIGVNE